MLTFFKTVWLLIYKDKFSRSFSTYLAIC